MCLSIRFFDPLTKLSILIGIYRSSECYQCVRNWSRRINSAISIFNVINPNTEYSIATLNALLNLVRYISPIGGFSPD